MHSHAPRPLGLLTLTLFIIGSIDSIRNLPAAAIFGESAIFFFLFGAITFLLPTALLSAELSSTWSEEGGIYFWVKKAFGDHLGVLAIWLQWVNTVVWVPTILSFMASTMAYLIDQHLANDPFYLVGTVLVLLWGMTAINLLGVRVSGLFASFCTIFGVFIPMFSLIALGMLWLHWGKPVHLNLSWHALVPTFNHLDSWISLTAIMTSFLGTELAAVNIRDVAKPRKNFPRALMIAVSVILLTMILGTLTIALMLPVDQINLMNGTMETLSGLLQNYHLEYLMPIAVIMIVLGALGEMVNWTTSPARGLAQTVDNGYLPKWLKSNNAMIPYSRILILQSTIATALSCLFVLFPKVNSFYWLLTDLSTEVYMLMYVMMYIAALRLAYKFPHDKGDFHLPGGIKGRWVMCVFGLVGCAITLTIGFLPPPNASVPFHHFSAVFALGLACMIMPVILLYAYKRWANK